ncbi:MAG: hypothetical protein ACXV7G_10415 [Halobacteriota archaeon]
MAGFKVTFPSKYKYSQNGNTPVKLSIFLDPANKVTGVNVGTEPSQGLPLDSWSTRYTNNLLDYQSVSYRQGLSNTTLGGQSAQTLTFQATVPVQYNKDQTIDQTIIVQEAWTVNNGTVFTVTYKAPPNDFSKFAPEAQKIVKSLRLT